MARMPTAVLLGATRLGSAGLATAAGLDVTTHNPYRGADLTPLLGASTVVSLDAVPFNAAVAMTPKTVAAARPIERVKPLAEQIAQ